MGFVNTYGRLAESIITQYGKKIRSDNFTYPIRHVCEMIAQEIAYFAKADAFEQSHIGESTFANDQFIVTYNGLSLSTDSNGNKYITMPSTPAGLPQNREVSEVNFAGNIKIQVIPMRNKDRFMQSFASTPKWMVLYYIEEGKIIFQNLSKMVTAPVNIKLVGAVGGGAGELVDLPLNIPRSTESMIFDKILLRMNQVRAILPDNVNDGISK